MTQLTYYEVLGIKRTASELDIKKAYKKLALQWHPDKNPHNKDEAENKFKQISEAYEVLVNREKRHIYDHYGQDGLKNGVSTGRSRSGASGSFSFGSNADFDPFAFGFSFRSPFDVFRDFFGDRDPFADQFFATESATPGVRQTSFGVHTDPFDDFFGFGSMFSGLHSMNSMFQSFPSVIHQIHHHHPALSALNAGNLYGRAATTAAPTSTGTTSAHTARTNLASPQQHRKPTGFCSTTSFTSAGPGKSAAILTMSTSTRFVDGKQQITKRTMQNGSETVEVLEDEKVLSRTVNGVQQGLIDK